MSWPRGFQSVVFFYLSCAPCVEARYRKKRKEESERGRAAREALAVEMPGMYRHPSPASTNPHWQTEIDAGPVLVARGRKKPKTNGTTASGKELKRGRGVTQSSNDSGLPSSVDLSLVGGSKDGRIDNKLHFQQFQRDDEQGPLSVLSMEGLASNSTLGGYSSGSQITRPPRALMADDSSYTPHRNPQINDLHPATVTRIASREEAKWLMAPPPTADFMEGKDRTSRSRSDSGGSRLSGRSAVPLSREMSHRIMERRRKNGDVLLVPTLSRETSQASNSPRGQNHDRDDVEERDFALDDSPRSRPRRPSHLGQNQISEASAASEATMIRRPDLAPEPVRTQRVASKPQLSTIASDSILHSDEYERTPKENIRHSDEALPERDRTARRSAVLMKDESLRVLQDLAPASPIFKSHYVSTQDLGRDPIRRMRQPSDQVSEGGALDVFDKWYNADFSSPDWIHEHTKREVKHRWSMDI